MPQQLNLEEMGSKGATGHSILSGSAFCESQPILYPNLQDKVVQCVLGYLPAHLQSDSTVRNLLPVVSGVLLGNRDSFIFSKPAVGFGIGTRAFIIARGMETVQEQEWETMLCNIRVTLLLLSLLFKLLNLQTFLGTRCFRHLFWHLIFFFTTAYMWQKLFHRTKLNESELWIGQARLAETILSPNAHCRDCSSSNLQRTRQFYPITSTWDLAFSRDVLNSS